MPFVGRMRVGGERGRVVAAGVKRVAATNAANRQVAATDDAVSLHARRRVPRARRLEAARRTEQRRDQQLVSPNQQKHDVLHEGPAFGRARSARTRASAPRRLMSGDTPRSSATICSSFSSVMGLRTMTTTSIPGIQTSRVARNASRTSRFPRLRTTALPSLRDATTPSRGFSSPSARPRRSRTKCEVDTLRPLS